MIVLVVVVLVVAARVSPAFDAMELIGSSERKKNDHYQHCCDLP